MNRLKHREIIDPHANKVCNGEEAAVIDGFVDVLPVSQDIVLLSEQAFQITKTTGVMLFAIKIYEIGLDKFSDLRCTTQKLAQPLSSIRKFASSISCGQRRANIAFGQSR